MLGMSFRCVVAAVLLLLFRTSTQQQELCVPSNRPAECADEQQHVKSANYALKVYSAEHYREEVLTVVTVHMTSCPYQGIPSPKWYKLTAVSGEGSTAVGRFEEPLRTMEASLCNDETEVLFRSCYPTQLDLPRSYKWVAPEESQEPLCFKLTILSEREGAPCEEVEVCANGMSGEGPQTEQPYEDANGMSGEGPQTEQPYEEGSAEMSTLSTIHQTELILRMTSGPSPEIIQMCQERRNCTGAKMRVFCGSDGKIYHSRCEMRYEECIHKLERNSISIAHVGYCHPTSPPPTSAAPPTKCEGEQAPQRPWMPKCDCEGLYKVIQCWENNNAVDCWCSNPNSGSEIGGTRRILECTDPESFDGLSNCLYNFA